MSLPFIETNEENDLEQTLVLVAAEADTRIEEHLNDDTDSKRIEENLNVEADSKNHISEVQCDDSFLNDGKNCVQGSLIVESNYNVKQTNYESMKKRKHCDINDDESANKPYKIPILVNTVRKEGSISGLVASHYNQLEEKGLAARAQSRIVYLRNFHNWIKSMFISEYIIKIKEKKKHGDTIKVLDMCCGKGGDLLKWQKSGIKHLICADIAAVSLNQCEARYEDLKLRSNRNRDSNNLFSTEFILADCTKDHLRAKYRDVTIKFDLTSCQFSFHYCFESLQQAEMMLKNATECITEGGYFIATIPDSNEIMTRLLKAEGNTFGNDIYEVTCDFNKNSPPLFGAQYHFKLEGVVNCPEFLVHFPTLLKLAERFGLKLLTREKFIDFFERCKSNGRNLLSNIRAFESFPPSEGTSLLGSEGDYRHAEDFLREKNEKLLGTLSKSEWEVSSLYMTFAFQKVKTRFN